MDKLTQSLRSSMEVIKRVHQQSLGKFKNNIQQINFEPQPQDTEIVPGQILVKIKETSIEKSNGDVTQWNPPQQSAVKQFVTNKIWSVTKNIFGTVQQHFSNSILILSKDFGDWDIDPRDKRSNTESDLDPPKTTPQRHLNQSSIRYKSNRMSRLLQIEEQKQKILNQIKNLDEQIFQLKGQRIASSLTKRRQSQIEMQQAAQKAKKLVSHYKFQKKMKQRQRRLKTQKLLSEMQRQQQQARKALEQRQRKNKEEKRRAISIRIEQNIQKRKQRVSIDKQSNKLVAQIKKQEEYLKNKQQIPEQIKQIQLKRAQICHKKDSVNMKDIKQHEKKYIAEKYHHQLQNYHQRASSIKHQKYKFEKNVWAAILEEQEKKKRDEQKIKQLKPQISFERRMKYGELVKNIFGSKSKGNKSTVSASTEKLEKPKTPEKSEFLALPAISESEKRFNDSKILKKIRQSKRISTSPGHLMVVKPKYTERQEKSPQEKQKQQERMERLIQLKKQTQERLKKLESFEPAMEIKQEKPQYKNYLGKVKLKKKENPKSWKKIIENKSLSHAQICDKMMKKVVQLQQQAKRKQNQGTELKDQQCIDLYINSIQAKLAMLQNL